MNHTIIQNDFPHEIKKSEVIPSYKRDYPLNKENFKNQQTFESVKGKHKRLVLRESDIIEQALIKLLKITVSMVKKHWAHIKNYEDFLKFIGNDLNEKVS